MLSLADGRFVPFGLLLFIHVVIYSTIMRGLVRFNLVYEPLYSAYHPTWVTCTRSSLCELIVPFSGLYIIRLSLHHIC